jgi:cobalamin biosynthetic protein CobC
LSAWASSSGSARSRSSISGGGGLLEHGGGVLAAARAYGHPPERWLDLSTGINPGGWPVGALPPGLWRRLPEADDGLLDVARDYYGTAHVTAAAGSQAAIDALPALRAPGRVAIVGPTYAEHSHAWSRAGHAVQETNAQEAGAILDEIDVLVACNPNNPTASRLSRGALLEWQARLADAGGWLVVDEAFADADPEESLARDCGRTGLVVLRSPGKFFGLAGMRLGFALGWAELVAALAERLGPWAVSAPARWVGRRALADRAWHDAERERLAAASARLAALLERHGLDVAGRTALFAWVRMQDAAALRNFLAARAILVRAFAQPRGLRFGLPGAPEEWARLEEALDAWRGARA